jgi:hypothetical protein
LLVVGIDLQPLRLKPFWIVVVELEGLTQDSFSFFDEVRVDVLTGACLVELEKVVEVECDKVLLESVSWLPELQWLGKFRPPFLNFNVAVPVRQFLKEEVSVGMQLEDKFIIGRVKLVG